MCSLKCYLQIGGVSFLKLLAAVAETPVMFFGNSIRLNHLIFTFNMIKLNFIILFLRCNLKSRIKSNTD